MKNTNKIVSMLALIALFYTPTIVHAWGDCCYVLYDQKTGHIVRLLGDRHASYITTGKETETEHAFIKNVRVPLDTYLQKKDVPEIFVVESGSGGTSEALKNNVFWCDDLMTQLVSFGYGLNHDSCGIIQKPNIPIVSFDFRGYFGLADFINSISYDQAPLNSLLKRKNVRNYWNLFLATFVKKHELYTYKYDTTIKQSLDSCKQKICEELTKIEKFFATAIDQVGLHPVRYLKKRYHCIKKKQDFLQRAENFAHIYLADYGFMSCIGKARAVKRNITLYTGSYHTKNIARELKKIGYQVLFSKERENDGETTLSKEDCETFFTIGAPKQLQLQEKSNNLKNMKFGSDEVKFVSSKL